jgi:hypothetical protein
MSVDLSLPGLDHRAHQTAGEARKFSFLVDSFYTQPKPRVAIEEERLDDG